MFAQLVEPGIKDTSVPRGQCSSGEYPTGKCERDGGAPVAVCNQSGTEPNRGIDLECIGKGGTPTGGCTEGTTPYRPVKE